ncbi:hypothetical protein COV93_04530 [Candidatus Woesearchaeota archaeon CG11_big_fil_rev_8_21_14_0_20_43_8]|nr:MAG: hypothetical protein COV93_04530 [Candidatus Woesearchaeota archaeon CG11_big_fil_rev_8_21_14_0_20_43_8]PIO05382.1 MAG: hypothetical protein COT47_05025 [Candidatus Woesearchaeota archaeon CG08_land_8_20_14_0_20_43_7]
MVNIKESIEGLQSNNDKIRYNQFKILLPISEKNPKSLYPFWDIFVDLLKKDEVSNKYYAICLIANVVKVDNLNKFEKIFNQFYKLLEHESPVVSPNVAGASGKIVNAKPHLESKITNKLLKVDSTSKSRYLDLMKSYVIQAFDEYFDKIKNKKRIIKFVEDQLNSTSPKTKKLAKEFLKKRNIE